MKILLTTILAISTATPLMANEYQPGYSTTRTCTRREYREEYIPGTPENPGYVKNWYEYVEVPCNPNQKANSEVDTNDCKEGSLIGGLIGAGLGAHVSRGKGRLLAVPAGGVTGALIGCQVDGG